MKVDYSNIFVQDILYQYNNVIYVIAEMKTE